MSGLDTIISTINSDAESEIKKIRSEEAREIAEINEKCKAEAKLDAEKRLADAAKKCEQIAENAESASEMLQKKAILNAKNNLINEVIESSKQKLSDLPDSEYFDFIKILIGKNIQSGSGVICFNKKDCERLPKDIIPEGLTLGEPLDIENGFILKYGDIEENCTFDAIISTGIDEIKDEICKVLF